MGPQEMRGSRNVFGHLVFTRRMLSDHLPLSYLWALDGICLTVYLSLRLSVCLSVRLFGWLAGWLTGCLSVCRSVYLSG